MERCKPLLTLALVAYLLVGGCGVAKADDLAAASELLLIGGSAARDWSAMKMRFKALQRDKQVGSVNAWINQFPYRQDPPDDPWDVPSELLARGAGDCEDFALSKFFMLRQLGVAPGRHQMRLAYVMLATMDGARPHMVVLLSEQPEDQQDPLVMDYPALTMHRLSARNDIRVVFQFDEQTIWGQGIERPSAYLSKWKRVVDQMDHEGAGRLQADSRTPDMVLPAPAALR